MYWCESWTIKKAEYRRTDAFELWCWRRLLRVPWPARRSSPSILKEISPEYSLILIGWCWSWNSNTLATWCEELTHLKRPWCWERLKAGGEGDNTGWDGWMASELKTWVWVNSGSWCLKWRPGVLQSMGSQGVRHDWATELNWGWKWEWKWKSSPTLWDPYGLHEILQARILEWVAVPFSRRSSQPRDRPRSPALQVDSLPSEPPGKPW